MSIFLGFLTSKLVEMARPKIFYGFVIHIKNTFCKKNDPDWSTLAPRASFISNTRV